jgi:hypothetical protein
MSKTPRKNRPQKFVSFSENQAELDIITKDMQDGWSIVNLIKNGKYYAGIMEKMREPGEAIDPYAPVYIPPRKKFKISS